MSVKHPVLEVLNGGPVKPAPVVPNYALSCANFPPGLFVRRRMCDLWYQRAQRAGSEKSISFEEALEVSVQAVAEILDEVMPPPCCLSASGALLLPSRQAVSSSRISLIVDGFVWQTAGGAKLLAGCRGPDGLWKDQPLNHPVTAPGRYEQDLALMQDVARKYKGGRAPGSSHHQSYKSGCFDLARALKDHYGKDIVLCAHKQPPLPRCYVHLRDGLGVGYERGVGYDSLLVALLQEQDLMRELLELFLPHAAEGWEVLRDQVGVEIIFLDEFMSGADVISPSLYRDLIAPYTKRAFEFFNGLGFKTVLVHGGSALPVLDVLKEIPWHGLLVEESRKNYQNDIGQVRRKLGTNRALFGNVDMQLLEEGSDQALLAEVRRQIDAAGRDAPFIVACGSPLTAATTADRLRLFCDSTRILESGQI